MSQAKTIILDRVIEEINIQIKNAEYGRSGAIEESKSHKGAMESRYDTFKEEAQYLAGGYDTQLMELNKILNTLKSIKNFPPSITLGSVYAIVEVKNIDDGTRSRYFLLPAGGGKTYDVGGDKIVAINMEAPIARAFIGTAVGDEVEIEIRGKTRVFNVVSIT